MAGHDDKPQGDWQAKHVSGAVASQNDDRDPVASQVDDRDPTPEDPASEEDRGRSYEAAGITVYFNARKCWHTGMCLRGLPAVFEVGRRPWVRADLDTPENIAAQIDKCPSGALSYDLHTAE